MSKVTKAQPVPARKSAKPTVEMRRVNILYFSVAVTAVFYLLSLFGVFFHESWRDEYQAFLVSQHSASLKELMYNMQYEGHPLLWHLLLFIQTRFTDSMLVTKIFHVSVAAVTVFLICRYIPLKLWQRVALCFSYFLFFEFNLITRNYVIGMMLFTLAVIVYRSRYIPQLNAAKISSSGYVYGFAAVLFLLANTSVFGIVMCGCMLALMACDAFVLMREKRLDTAALLRYGIPTATALVGIVICYYFIKPEPDNTFDVKYTHGFNSLSLQAMLDRMFTNLVMILPFDRLQFWNRHLFDSGSFSWLPLLSVLLLTVIALYFIKNNRLFLFCAVGALGVMGFVYFTNMAYVRYSGHWFIIFVMAYVLSLDYKQAKPLVSVPRLNGIGSVFAVVFNVVLVTSLWSGLAAYAQDARYPFSNLDIAGKYLLDQGWQRYPVVGSTDFVISPLSYFTHKPIRLAESQRLGWFVRWNRERRSEKLHFPDIIAEMDTVMNKGNDTLLLILDTPMRIMVNGEEVLFSENDLPDTNIHLKLVHSVDEPCIVPDESYYFYFATKRKAAGS